MRTPTTSIPCALARISPHTSASTDELRALRAAAWHQQGIVVMPIAEVFVERDRLLLTDIANRHYGVRTQSSRKNTPWQEGDVIDRNDGETWTVVAAIAKSVTVQRSRDGALGTLGQLGEGRR